MIKITLTWRPKDVTTEPLLKDGFSQDQLDDIGKVFVHRYNGQTLANAGSMYSKMVRDSGSGHDVKQRPNDTKEIIDTKTTDLKNKSKDGAERAQEAKQQAGVMTQSEVESYYNERKLVK